MLPITGPYPPQIYLTAIKELPNLPKVRAKNTALAHLMHGVQDELNPDEMIC